MVNKVYSMVFGTAIVGGGLGFIMEGVNITSPGREIKLKRVYFDVQIYESVTAHPLNLNTQITQRYYLMIGVGGIPLITNVFEPDVAFPPTIVQNANSIIVSKVGTIEFDSFIIANQIPFRYFAVNYDLLLAYDHRVTLVAETEEHTTN